MGDRKGGSSPPCQRLVVAPQPSILLFRANHFMARSEGIRSERKLIETASLNLAHRWYLGYALDEELPDHSSLTRIRQRLGIDVFQRFFEKIVDLCQDAGLVWGRELYFDATKVEANAGIPSLIPRFYYEAKTHVADLFVDEEVTASSERKGLAASDGLPDEIVLLPTTSNSEGSPAEADSQWRLLEERRSRRSAGAAPIPHPEASRRAIRRSP
jgi:hypothetical protein